MGATLGSPIDAGFCAMKRCTVGTNLTVARGHSQGNPTHATLALSHEPFGVWPPRRRSEDSNLAPSRQPAQLDRVPEQIEWLDEVSRHSQYDEGLEAIPVAIAIKSLRRSDRQRSTPAPAQRRRLPTRRQH